MIETLTSASAVADLERVWTELQEAEPSTPFYVHHHVVHAWCSAYEDDPAVHLRILVVRQNDAVVGIAPLALRSGSGTRGRTVVWASHGDYLDVLIDPQVSADAVCKELVDHVHAELGADSVRLGGIPQGSRLLHWLLRSPHNPEVRPHVENPQIILSRFSGPDGLRGGVLPSKTRKYRNKLFREHDVAFRVLHDTDDELLTRLAQVHVAEKQHLQALGRDERHSLFEDPRRVAFLRGVTARPGSAVTFTLETADGRLAAYRTCFRNGRTLLSWNSAYAPAFEDYRLGKVIQYEILRHLVETGEADVFDLGAGRYAWKFEWTPDFLLTYRWVRRAERAVSAASESTAGQDRTSSDPAPTGNGAAETPTSGADRAEVSRRLVRAVGRRALTPLANARRLLHRYSAAPVVVYVPHPDDETIFMGASLHRLTRERRVILVPLTQGAASNARGKLAGQLGREVGVQEFVQARRSEMLAAVKHLGIRPESLRWQDLPDGAVQATDVLTLIMEMEERHPGAEHRTMSYLDPHRDHRAAGEALRTAYRQGIVTHATFHLPVSLVPNGWGQRVRLSAPDLEAKRAALDEYRRWKPAEGRLAVGQISVPTLIETQHTEPVERTHRPDYEPRVRRPG